MKEREYGGGMSYDELERGDMGEMAAFAVGDWD